MRYHSEYQAMPWNTRTSKEGQQHDINPYQTRMKVWSRQNSFQTKVELQNDMGKAPSQFHAKYTFTESAFITYWIVRLLGRRILCSRWRGWLIIPRLLWRIIWRILPLVRGIVLTLCRHYSCSTNFYSYPSDVRSKRLRKHAKVCGIFFFFRRLRDK